MTFYVTSSRLGPVRRGRLVETAIVSEPAAELSAGQVFAGWQVERELARGGMGVLYLARHPRLPRTDVIKVLPPWLSSDERFRERFLREVTRMSTLSHPHVMPIHDSGEAHGTLYLVMPYISGGDLRSLLRSNGPLAPARAARLIVQIGAALDAAHRIGVVHRDVKPENVLLSSVEPDDDDHALLTDFGISREDMATNSLTATGELLLTPAYAAPEQVLGKVVDARADQYALGCILFELLSGRPPFVNDVQVVMLMAHLQEQVPPIAAELGLPPAIDGVLAKAMAKSPEDRYENCRALAQATIAALDLTVSNPRASIDLGETGYAPPPFVTPLPTPPPTQPTPPSASQPPTSPPPTSPPPTSPPPTSPPPSAPPLRNERQTNALTPAYGTPGPPIAPYGTPPGHQPGPPPGPRKSRRGLWIGLGVLVVAGAAAGIIAATGGGSSSHGTAAYSALLTRIPADVRGNCKDTTGELSAAEKPFVVTRASCTHDIDGRNLDIAYRTVPGSDATVQKFRNSVLQIGSTFHSRGDCLTFTSTDPAHHGTKGFGEDIVAPPLVGALWCDTDGTETYLPTNAAPGHTRILTQVMTSAGGGQAGAGQRVKDLVAVLPAE